MWAPPLPPGRCYGQAPLPFAPDNRRGGGVAEAAPLGQPIRRQRASLAGAPALRGSSGAACGLGAHHSYAMPGNGAYHHAQASAPSSSSTSSLVQASDGLPTVSGGRPCARPLVPAAGMLQCCQNSPSGSLSSELSRPAVSNTASARGLPGVDGHPTPSVSSTANAWVLPGGTGAAGGFAAAGDGGGVPLRNVAAAPPPGLPPPGMSAGHSPPFRGPSLPQLCALREEDGELGAMPPYRHSNGPRHLPPLSRGFNSYEAAASSPCSQDESETSTANSESGDLDPEEDARACEELLCCGIAPSQLSLINALGGLSLPSTPPQPHCVPPPAPLVPPLAFLPAAIFEKCTLAAPRGPCSGGSSPALIAHDPFYEEPVPQRREWRADVPITGDDADASADSSPDVAKAAGPWHEWRVTDSDTASASPAAHS